MRSWKVWSLVAVIFATGAAVGAFGMRAYLFRHLPELLARPAERLEDRILTHIDQEVGLSATQREAIRPLIKAAVAKAHAAHQAVRAELEPTFTQMDDAIAAQLEPGQQAKFAEFRARMERFRRTMPPGPPPGGMPGPPPGFGPPPQ